MVVKTTRAIKADRQWLLNYGPNHQCGERVTCGKRRRSGGTGGKRKIQKFDDGTPSPAGTPVDNEIGT